MIQTLLMILLALATVYTQKESSEYKLSDLRRSYLKASKSERVSKDFYKLMLTYEGGHPTVLAYGGAAEATMAKHVWNPYSKLKFVKSALERFDKAVKLDKKNPEIRFLRFTVEHYIPRYLDLSQHLEEDKRIVINALKQYPESGLPKDLAQTIYDFLLTKDHLTEAEKAELKKISID